MTLLNYGTYESSIQYLEGDNETDRHLLNTLLSLSDSSKTNRKLNVYHWSLVFILHLVLLQLLCYFENSIRDNTSSQQ